MCSFVENVPGTAILISLCKNCKKLFHLPQLEKLPGTAV